MLASFWQQCSKTSCIYYRSCAREMLGCSTFDRKCSALEHLSSEMPLAIHGSQARPWKPPGNFLGPSSASSGCRLTPLEKKTLFFLTPRGPLIPKSQIYICSNRIHNKFKGFGIGFCQDSIVQALGQHCASRRGFSHARTPFLRILGM